MARAMNLVSSFIQEQPYPEVVNEIESMSKITKQQLVDFAKKNFGNNYVVVYKRTGVDNTVKKVTKPQITPVVMQRDKESEFCKGILAAPVIPIEPRFLDYKRDMRQLKTSKGINVIYVPNHENNTFTLSYYFEMGSQNDLRLATAASYLSYLGTKTLSAEKLKQEFYKIGCTYSVSVGSDDITISLSGLSDNTTKAVTLLEQLMSDPQPDSVALRNLIADIIKTRADNKLNKNIIRQGLTMYGTYGPKSPFTNVLNDKEIKSLRSEELVGLIHGLNSYKHDILYYGPMSYNDITGRRPDPVKNPDLIAFLEKYHLTPPEFHPVPPRVRYEQLATDETKVFVVDYNMKQADIVLHSKSVPFNAKELPVSRMFNEYFGAGMNSIVFQEIREAKALAYSSTAAYRNPTYPDENNTIFGFVGTQNDKMPEALKAMFTLFNDMPQSEKSFAAAKESIMNQISSEQITKMRIINNYLTARRFGYDHDIRQDIYTKVPSFTFNDIHDFQQQYLKNRNYSILVVGNTKKMDISSLQSYGTVTFLKLNDIFGY